MQAQLSHQLEAVHGELRSLVGAHAARLDSLELGQAQFGAQLVEHSRRAESLAAERLRAHEALEARVQALETRPAASAAPAESVASRGEAPS
eukprot:1981898-Lingulodinium_polyedra.AAC.1